MELKIYRIEVDDGDGVSVLYTAHPPIDEDEKITKTYTLDEFERAVEDQLSEEHMEVNETDLFFLVLELGRRVEALS